MTLFGKERIFADGIKFKVLIYTLSWIIQVGLKCPYKCPCMRGGMGGGEESADRRARGDVTAEAEIGVMWPQGTPGAPRGWNSKGQFP